MPERIILFGSAARDMNANSDVDLLIIKAGVDTVRLMAQVYRRLGNGVGAAVDAIVVTPADAERFKDSHALIIKPALREEAG